MMCRPRLLSLRTYVCEIVEEFIKRAEVEFEAKHVMASYTHIQHAQPVSVAFWLSQYAAQYLRDATRLKNAYTLTNQNPLGGGAISGTSFPIDRQLTTSLLGFDGLLENTLDATGARDYMLDVLSANAILQTNASRLAEEFILWSSYEFGSVVMSDAHAMGSSMMPQKKNPGTLELMRGRAGRVIGSMIAGFTMLKGLPSGYNRDFHEEKEILFESLTLVNRAMEVLPTIVSDTTFKYDRMKQLSYGNFAAATELANLIVRKNIPFREAHHIVGTFVGDCVNKGVTFEGQTQACLEHLQSKGVEVSLEDVEGALESEKIVASYNSFGGTGPQSVRNCLDNQKADLERLRSELKADEEKQEKAYQACRNISGEAGNVTSLQNLQELVQKYKPT